MKLSRVNSLLLVTIIIVNGYTLLAPLLPELLYARQKQINPPAELEQKLYSGRHTMPTSMNENRLIIPTLGLDQQVYEGETAKTLAKGLWHRPASGTPDKNGNTVISGHRFTYNNPQGALYHLNKVKLGDMVGLLWNDKPYRYKVTEIKTVAASDNTVEAPTTEARLTIYTCTPLWLPKDRLVIVAKLELDSNHE